LRHAFWAIADPNVFAPPIADRNASATRATRKTTPGRHLIGHNSIAARWSEPPGRLVRTRAGTPAAGAGGDDGRGGGRDRHAVVVAQAVEPNANEHDRLTVKHNVLLVPSR